MITVDNTSTGYGARFHLKKVGPTWSLSDKQLSLEAQFETWEEAVKAIKELSSCNASLGYVYPYYPSIQPSITWCSGGQTVKTPNATWTVA